MTLDITLTDEERMKLGDAIGVGMPNFIVCVVPSGPLALTIEKIIRDRVLEAGGQTMVDELKDLRDYWDAQVYFDVAAMQLKNSFVRDLNKILGER